MCRWQEEVTGTSAGVMSRGEVRDYEADAAFHEILEETEFRLDSAQTPAEALAIEVCGKVKAQRVWDSYYESWELDKLSDSVRISFPEYSKYMLIGSEEIVNRYNVNEILSLGLEKGNVIDELN